VPHDGHDRPVFLAWHVVEANGVPSHNIGVVDRAIGVLTMIDSGASDDKIIAVATNDPEFGNFLEARDLPPHRLLVLKRFFQDYKQLEGKQVQVEDIKPASAAMNVIERALTRYNAMREHLLVEHH
jgi:inorganic pyrophosphatase